MYHVVISEGAVDDAKGDDFFFGRNGVSQDYKQAFEFYLKAANVGHASSQNQLGVMYDNGEGVDKDSKTAFQWYRKAVQQGNPDAQFNLGNMYFNGEGVDEDHRRAIHWYQKA